MTTQELKADIRARTARAYTLNHQDYFTQARNWDTDNYRIYAEALGFSAWLINHHFPLGEN